MTKSESIENTVSTMLLACLVVALSRPDWSWALWSCIALVLLGAALSFAASTPADRERRRRNAWVFPVAMVALAAQQVYFASPGENRQAILLAAGLVAVGIVNFVVRRRAA